MKENKKNRCKQFLRCGRGIFYKNPVLSFGLALPFAVVVTTSLQSGVALSLAALVTYFPTVMVASLVGERLPHWLRVAVYPLAAALFLLPARYLISQLFVTAADTMGAYMSMLCVSTMLLFGVEEAVALHSHKKTFLYGLRTWLGFTLVVVLISLMREMIGSGSVWHTSLSWVPVKLPGVLVACGGWIFLGFMAALGKKLHRGLLALFRRSEEQKKAAQKAKAMEQ